MSQLRTALIAAAVAAAIAAGTAGAATTLITGAQIKNGSIGLVDLKPNAVQALRGQSGPMGPAGPAGTAGAPGPAGGFDPAKVTYVTGTLTSVWPYGLTKLTAYCPTGTKVLGGGYFTSMGFPYSAYSISGLEYTVSIDNYSGSITGTGYAWAVCAAP